MAKLPLPPAPEHVRGSGDPAWAADVPDLLWRIRFTRTNRRYAWNQFRTFGPLDSARFDPHQSPPHEQAEGVAYFGVDWPVCLAEIFQEDRTIHAERLGPYITGVTPTRPLWLLDLRHDWPLTIGASHHINTGRKDYCRAWARTLRQAWPRADGLASVGINAGTVVTLFNPAADSLGANPRYDQPLAAEAHEDHLATAAEQINYDLVWRS